jgi:predicted lipoprotein with Yx(FWY)xxD motif
VVDAAAVGTYGTILTSSSGYTLYRYVPDGTGPPTCTGACATTWPPLTVPPGTTTVPAGPGVSAADVGAVTRPDGSIQVTYEKMPLYTYAGDAAPGRAEGQGIGGQWYVIPVGAAAAGSGHPSTTTTTRASGY